MSRSLAAQFFLLGGVVAIACTILVGLFVASLIERAVTRNAAATTALYVDSVIAPLLPDMSFASELDPVVQRALDETLGQGALGDRLLAMRIWSTDGRVLYADNAAASFEEARTPSAGRLAASRGEIAAEFDASGSPDGQAFRTGGPILKIYNPILQPWTGAVVAVIEFYERADELEIAIASARLKSWLAVAAATIVFFLMLGAIVVRGSRTIDRQAADLKERVGELTALLRHNGELHDRVRGATQRATSLNESYLRRLGAELHDGPAQLIALASLRLDSDTVAAGVAIPTADRESEVEQIRTILDEALQEIRAICRGLVLPKIENKDLAGVVRQAIGDYEQHTGTKVGLSCSETDVPLAPSQRMCVYRFLQEGLNNGFHHCRGAGQHVGVVRDGSRIRVWVSDEGKGFDPSAIRPGSLGIDAMRERIESLGGSFDLVTSRQGTTLAMTLEIDRMTS